MGWTSRLKDETTNGQHEHDWYPLASYEGESTSDSEEEVALWACAGRTRFGKCLAIRTAGEMDSEERKRQQQEALVRAEREQRHFQW